MTKQQEGYGSIPDADEETALITRVGGVIHENANEEDLYTAQHPRNTSGKGVLMTVMAVAVFAFLAFSGASPVSAVAKSSGGGAPGAPAFDWKAYGANIKSFWADQKAKWAEKKAEMKANNATAAEAKEAKHMFWNSTMPEFSDVLNTTKAADRQRKEAEKTANKAAIDEAMAEVEAQRSKGSN